MFVRYPSSWTSGLIVAVLGALACRDGAPWSRKQQAVSAAGDSATTPSAQVRTAAQPSALVAKGDSREGARPAGAADSARRSHAPPPRPADFEGTWVHGDGRSRYEDSLALVLHRDGTADGEERGYTLDNSGWHMRRVAHLGRWAAESDTVDSALTSWKRDTGSSNLSPSGVSMPRALCVIWRSTRFTPKPRTPVPPQPVLASGCNDVRLYLDSAERLRMDFGGRHWLKANEARGGSAESGKARRKARSERNG
jgi:hypothetical protein